MSLRPFLLAGLLASVGLSCAGKEPPITSEPGKPAVSKTGVTEIAMPALEKIVAGQTIYVPLYSYALTSDNADRLDLASTLFVRNTDPNRPIIVIRVDYYDSGGKMIRKFLKSPIRIDPLAATSFFVKESDETGGLSPSFLVQWISTEPASDPVAESLMIGTVGTQGISFLCSGRVIARHQP